MKSLLAELNMRYFNSANGLFYLLFYGDEPSQPAFRLKTSPAVGCACLRAYEESIDKHESGAIPNSCR